MEDPEDMIKLSPGFPLSRETVKRIVEDVQEDIFAESMLGIWYDYDMLKDIVVARVQQKMEEIIRCN